MIKKHTLLFSIMMLTALMLAACSTGSEAPRPGSSAETMEDTETGGADEPAATMVPQSEEMPKDETAGSMDSDHTAEPDMEEAEPMADQTMSTEEGSMETVEEMADIPAWFTVELSDVRSGETFTIHDLHGKVVLVETMAIWCSNCRKQQENVIDLHGLIGERDDFVSVGLDIDPNEDAASLAEYIEKNGFHWTYAVVPPEVGSALANLYGSQYLNPPSTPMLIIDRDGTVHLLPFGIKSPEQLQEALIPFLSDSM